MVVDDLVRTLGRDGFREQIVDGLGSGAAAVVALAFAPATNGADGFQTGQKTDALQPADMVGDDGALRLPSSRSLSTVGSRATIICAYGSVR